MRLWPDPGHTLSRQEELDLLAECYCGACYAMGVDAETPPTWSEPEPSRWQELGSGVFLGDLPEPCRCGSEQAEIYVGDDEIFRVCIRCGDETRLLRLKRERKRRTMNAETPSAEQERRDHAAMVKQMRKVAARIDRQHGRRSRPFGA